MSAFASKVSRAFKERKHRILEVPEWGVTIHVFPLTLGQLSRIQEETDPMKRLVRVLMVRARKADGTPLFDLEDCEALLAEGVDGFGPDVVMRVVTEIGVSEFTDEAQAEKN